MDPDPTSRKPHTPYLHPRVYRAMLAMGMLYVLAVWFGFAQGRYIDFLLVVVSAFLVMTAALPLLAWRQWRGHPTRGPHHKDTETFHQWSEHEFDTFTGATSGRLATIEILLPLGAVAVGMLVFAMLTRVMG